MKNYLQKLKYFDLKSEKKIILLKNRWSRSLKKKSNGERKYKKDLEFILLDKKKVETNYN